ncbi:ATP-grasp domain-containing protein [Aureitalea marina]|uniref:Alpha-L-glutamate ligase n=1 Tax=Aureitalea marina TaxID=930804 RepID=A0A2S7KSL2_9FLAO|nr:RimK family alpha-L-glutamate ligase [Aureitalea marina]PQB05606.1 alpha-L-glutamate ligase [Aureitalea marina]
MNIAILSRGEHLYSTQSLLKAGMARNHVMEVLDPAYCSLETEEGQNRLYYHNELVDDLHALIPRVGASNTYFGSTIVRHFQAMGIFCVSGAEPILQSRNKWTCFQILAQARIPIPKTTLGMGYDPESALDRFGPPPYIIKLLQGTHGNGVILAESKRSALSTIETLKAAKVRFIIQEFIAESKGSDIRAIVVDGKIVAAMKRQGKEGEFRSNLHRGGSAEALKLDHKLENLALRAAKALRLGVCGVDLLESNSGPMVLEVNSTPGLEGIETTTGIDVSGQIISYIERNKRQ